MKILKKRKIAILLTAAVMILSVLYGVHRSLDRLARDIEETFYSGVYLEKEGYRQAAIGDHLAKIAEAALGTVTIARNYPELEKAAEAVQIKRQELLESETIARKRSPYVSLQVYYQELYDLANNLGGGLSERDKTALDHYYATFIGASTAIANSNYNDAVNDFHNGESYSFLAHVLKPLAFVTPPQGFV